jgi:hypothetical protein
MHIVIDTFRFREFYFLGYNAVYALNSNRRFEGTRRLHLQCLRVSQARNQQEAVSKER